MIEITQVSKDNLRKYQPVVGCNCFHSNSIWFVASINNVPCGILLASEDQKKKKKTCNINTLFVPSLLRREGIATRLFDTLLNKCKEEGLSKIVFNSVADKESIETLNLFLKNYGFKPAKIVANIYTFNDLSSILKNKLVKYSITRDLTPPPGIKILPLNEADPNLVDNVVEKLGIDYPDYYAIFPVDIEPQLNQINTFVAVADDKEIVGWLTGLDVFGGSIYYKTFFVKEEYRHLAVGFYLMCYCVKNHAAKYLYRPALCGVSLKNPDADKFNATYFKDVNKSISYEFIYKKINKNT